LGVCMSTPAPAASRAATTSAWPAAAALQQSQLRMRGRPGSSHAQHLAWLACLVCCQGQGAHVAMNSRGGNTASGDVALAAVPVVGSGLSSWVTGLISSAAAARTIATPRHLPYNSAAACSLVKGRLSPHRLGIHACLPLEQSTHHAGVPTLGGQVLHRMNNINKPTPLSVHACAEPCPATPVLASGHPSLKAPCAPGSEMQRPPERSWLHGNQKAAPVRTIQASCQHSKALLTSAVAPCAPFVLGGTPPASSRRTVLRSPLAAALGSSCAVDILAAAVDYEARIRPCTCKGGPRAGGL